MEFAIEKSLFHPDLARIVLLEYTYEERLQLTEWLDYTNLTCKFAAGGKEHSTVLYLDPNDITIFTMKRAG